MPLSRNAERTIAPTHPGILLREEFMPDYDLTVSSLAAALHVSRQSVNELLHGRRVVTPMMALRLGRIFGNSPAFWLNAQMALDLWTTEQNNHEELQKMLLLKAA